MVFVRSCSFPFLLLCTLMMPWSCFFSPNECVEYSFSYYFLPPFPLFFSFSLSFFLYFSPLYPSISLYLSLSFFIFSFLFFSPSSPQFLYISHSSYSFSISVYFSFSRFLFLSYIIQLWSCTFIFEKEWG